MSTLPRRIHGFPVVCLVLAILALACGLRGQPAFNLRHEQTDGATLWDITEGSNGMVAVGTAGTILHSANGSNWNRVESGTSAWLVAVTFAEGRYVAVGEAGIILRSTNAVDWTPIADSPTDQRLNNVLFADGQWVAVGEAGTIITSRDSATWDDHSIASVNWLRGLARVPVRATDYRLPQRKFQMWVATGQNSILVVSEDGLAWRPMTIHSGLDNPYHIDSEAIIPLPNGSGDFWDWFDWGYSAGIISVGSDGSLSQIAIDAHRTTEPFGSNTIPWASFTRALEVNPDQAWRSLAVLDGVAIATGGSGATATFPASTANPIQPNYPPPQTSANLVGSGFGLNALWAVGTNETILASDLPSPSYLANISTRGRVESTAKRLVAGVAVSGDAPIRMMVRGVGPGLRRYGIRNALNWTTVQVFNPDQSLLAETDGTEQGHGGGAATYFSTVGAFEFEQNSLDSAVMFTTDQHIVTATLDGAAKSGVGLIEFYDVPNGDGSHLVNLSTRGRVGSGEDVLVAGFSVKGDSALTLLIRGIGPGLAAFGVSDPVADPRLQLFSSSQTLLNENDDWGTPQESINGSNLIDARDLPRISQELGAFPLETDSTDAALLVTVIPGNYTVILSASDDTPGEGMVEIYQIH